MERLENLVVCVKAAWSQLCVREWMFFQGEGISFPLVLCWICSERNVKVVLVWVVGFGSHWGCGCSQGVTEGWLQARGSKGWRELALQLFLRD